MRAGQTLGCSDGIIQELKLGEDGAQDRVHHLAIPHRRVGQASRTELSVCLRAERHSTRGTIGQLASDEEEVEVIRRRNLNVDVPTGAGGEGRGSVGRLGAGVIAAAREVLLAQGREAKERLISR